MPGRIKIRAICTLQCPYCLRRPLRKPGSWFQFEDGCPDCGYRYEREEGYFVGAPWMISYPLIGVLCLIFTVILYPIFAAQFGMLALALLLASGASILALLFYPFARAIWLVGDHLLHP